MAEKKDAQTMDDRKPLSSRAKRSKGAQNPVATLKRIVGMVFKFYPVLLPIFIICIITPAILQSLPSIFLQEALAVVGDYWKAGDWASAAPLITGIALRLIVVYIISLVLSVLIPHPFPRSSSRSASSWAPSSRRAPSCTSATRCSSTWRTCRSPTSTATSMATS